MYEGKRIEIFSLGLKTGTRIDLLKDWNSEQLKNIQKECDHLQFDQDKRCGDCRIKCDHVNFEEGFCLDCGSEVSSDGYGDFLCDIEMERRLENE